MKYIKVKISIKPDSKPKFPYAIRPKVEADLDALVKNKVLEPVSMSKWATLIIPVLKKDGGVRICGVFKVTINPELSAEQYPLLHINNPFENLAGGQKFCQAYLQMDVDEKSKELLTVVVHKGLALQVLSSTIWNHKCSSTVPEGGEPDLVWIARSTVRPG